MDDETRPGEAMPTPDRRRRADPDDGGGTRRRDRGRPGVRAGSDRRPPGPHRRGRRAAACLPAHRGGRRPGRRPRGGRAPRGGGRARAAGRRAAGPQGRLHDHGHADHLRLPHPRQLAAAVRRDRDPPAPRGWRGAAGQVEHGRVRDGLVHRELGVRAIPQPVGPGPGTRRVVGRLGRGGRGLRGPARHRHRHRRVDPAARRGVRDRRGQADLRRAVPVRADRLRVVAGHPRAAGPDRAGCGPAARGDLRP